MNFSWLWTLIHFDHTSYSYISCFIQSSLSAPLQKTCILNYSSSLILTELIWYNSWSFVCEACYCWLDYRSWVMLQAFNLYLQFHKCGMLTCHVSKRIDWPFNMDVAQHFLHEHGRNHLKTQIRLNWIYNELYFNVYLTFQIDWV
jgi:hypothetical protein